MAIAIILLASAVSSVTPTVPEEIRPATVAYQVGANGRVTSCFIRSSSGDPKLDARACRLVMRKRPQASGTATFPPQEIRLSHD